MSNTVKASEAIRLKNAQKYYSGYNTHLYTYKMNSTTYQKRIKKNIEMNKNLMYTPAEERYWLRLRTAVSSYFFIFIVCFYYPKIFIQWVES